MPATPVLSLTLVIMAIGIYIPYSWLAPQLGLVPLPAMYFAWLIAILLSYAALTHVVKMWFVRRYGFN